MKRILLLILTLSPTFAAAEVVVFQQCDIPAGVPPEGNGAGAKKYGYRIPSLCVTNKGSILAFTERRLGLHDHARNDIVLKRSADGGMTWGGEIVAVEEGTRAKEGSVKSSPRIQTTEANPEIEPIRSDSRGRYTRPTMARSKSRPAWRR